MSRESISDFCERMNDDGYGVALVEPDGETIVAPYVDPDDYPDLEVLTSQTSPNGVITGSHLYKGYSLVLHSGGLEETFHAKRHQQNRRIKRKLERLRGYTGPVNRNPHV